MAYNDTLDKIDAELKKQIKQQSEGNLSGSDERRRDREEAAEERKKNNPSSAEGSGMAR